MTTLAHDIPMTSHWRLGAWAARAWQRMGWRHVLLALALHGMYALFRPLGGILLTPDVLPTYGIENLLNGSWLVSGVPIVYGVLVADEAFNDGVPPLRAYAPAVVAPAALVPVVLWNFLGFMVPAI